MININIKLKEEIMLKAKEENNVSLLNWNDICFKDIELNLLSYYEIDGTIDEDGSKKFLDNINFKTDKFIFLNEIFSNGVETKEDLLESFVYCETVDEFINTTLDGYGMILDNQVIVYFKEL